MSLLRKIITDVIKAIKARASEKIRGSDLFTTELVEKPHNRYVTLPNVGY